MPVGAALNATVRLRDGFGRPTSKRVEIGADTLATAEAAIATYLPLLDALTDLACEGVIYSGVDGSATFAGEATSSVDVGVTFRGRVESGEIAVLKVSGFPVAKVGAGGYVDLADLDVAPFLAQYESAGALYLSDGEKVAIWIDGTLDR